MSVRAAAEVAIGLTTGPQTMCVLSRRDEAAVPIPGGLGVCFSRLQAQSTSAELAAQSWVSAAS